MNTENNKIIAEFLCTTQKTEGLDDCYILKSMAYHIEDLKFDTDWNWLMEVVEKIEKVGKTEFKFSVEFEKVKLSSNIESVYNACVEFIKWYNQKTN
jgi:hypothetical protein